MSGGHFDYSYASIEYIVEEIKELVEFNDSDEKDEWGDKIGRNYPPRIIKKFKEAINTLEKAQKMAKRIDWLVSGDDSEVTFLERWREEIELSNEKTFIE